MPKKKTNRTIDTNRPSTSNFFHGQTKSKKQKEVNLDLIHELSIISDEINSSDRKNIDIDLTDQSFQPAIDHQNTLNCNEIVNDELEGNGHNHSNELPHSTNPQGNALNLEFHLLQFLSRLYDMSEIPRTKIDDIINNVSDLLKLTLHLMKSDVKKMLTIKFMIQNTFEITDLFDEFVSKLPKYDTERKRFNKFKNNNTFVPPEKYQIGERKEFRMNNGTIIYKNIPVYCQFIPMRKVLKIFFEMPEYYSSMVNYVHQLERTDNEIISNFIQASLWKKKKKHSEIKLYSQFSCFLMIMNVIML